MILNKILAYSETHNNLEQEADCQSQLMILNSPQTLTTPIAQCKLVVYWETPFRIISKGSFPQRQLPIGIFPCGNFPIVQFPKRHNLPCMSQPQCSAPYSLSVRPPLAPPSCRTWPPCQPAVRLKRLNLSFGKLPLGKLNIW